MTTQDEATEKLENLLGSSFRPLEVDVIAEAAFPPHWPKNTTSSPDNKNIKFFSLQCEGELPTDKEVDILIDNISRQYDGKIEGWLLRLGYIMIPGFEGEDPTIEEFFSENFDSKRVKPKALLVSYPIVSN